jgi:hypothetical protein
MIKYQWTQFTPGHVQIPVYETDGKVKMNVPDPAKVAAAIATNEKHETIVRKGLKQSLIAQNKLKGVKSNVDVQVANAKIGPKVRVPKAAPVVTDVLMVKNGVYDLPENNANVVAMVKLGYLKVYTAPVA